MPEPAPAAYDRAMPSEPPAPSGPSFAARVLIGAVLALVAIIVLQWVLAAVLGAIRFVLFIGVVLAAGFWVVTAKANR